MISTYLVCSATFLTNVQSQDSATEWIANFQQQTKTTYRITRGVHPKGKRIKQSATASTRENKLKGHLNCRTALEIRRRHVLLVLL